MSGGKAAADMFSSILSARSVGIGIGAVGNRGQDVPARLTGTRLAGAREGLASAGVSAKGTLAAGVARSTVVLKTVSVESGCTQKAAAARARMRGTRSCFSKDRAS